jgi:hypothetical protein
MKIARLIAAAFTVSGGGVDKPAPTFVGHGGMVTGNVPYPAGIQAGDLLILSCFNGGVGLAPSAITGWTNYNVVVTNSNNGLPYLTGLYSVFFRIADGSEIGTVVVPSGSDRRYIMTAFRGVGSHSAQGGTSNTSTNGGHTFPSITTTNNNVLVVYQAVRDGDTINEPFNQTIPTFLTNPDLAEITNRFNQRTTAGNGSGFGIATGVKESAGTVQSCSFALGPSTGIALPWLIVLNPA